MKTRRSAGWRILSAIFGPTLISASLRLAWPGLLLLAALLTSCAGPSSHQDSSAPRIINFDSSPVGQLPPDFSLALTGGGGPISWVVREDLAAPDRKRVLIQESSDDTNYRFPMCIYDKTVARDVTVQVDYKAISGKVDQAGGIVLRYTPGNYYIARANALEDNVILFKTVDGKRSKIVEVPVKVTAAEWHTLRFEAQGAHLKVFFDGKTVIEKDDTTFSRPGRVGLWTKADSVSAFDNLKIERVP